jgi:predicted O-methyltransferase YrrM
MIFIDADKENNPTYFEWALRLSRPGTVIVVDNVVRNGKVLGNEVDDPSIRGVRNLIDLAKREKSVESTAIQAVSGKGYDGFMVIRVKD